MEAIIKAPSSPLLNPKKSQEWLLRYVIISFPLQGDEIQMFNVSAAWVKEGTPAPSHM